MCSEVGLCMNLLKLLTMYVMSSRVCTKCLRLLIRLLNSEEFTSSPSHLSPILTESQWFFFTELQSFILNMFKIFSTYDF